jgi:hypothetical protein
VLLWQYLPHIFLELETFQEKYIENQNTGTIYEIILKNMIEPGRPQTTVWITFFAFWINKATNALLLCNIYCLSTATIVIGTCRNISMYVLFHPSYIYYYCGISVLFLVESSPCSLLSGIVSKILPPRICHCSFDHQNFTLKQDREDNRLAKNSHVIVKRVYITYLIN